MNKLLVTAGLAIALVAGVTIGSRSLEAGKSAGPVLSHDVYFALKDKSPAEVTKLIHACNKYLTKHDGEVFFGAGPIAAEFKREVNDQAFDVALHIVFADKAAHDKYQDHPRHIDFIKENKDNWAKVRVFDSYIQK